MHQSIYIYNIIIYTYTNYAITLYGFYLFFMLQQVVNCSTNRHVVIHAECENKRLYIIQYRRKCTMIHFQLILKIGYIKLCRTFRVGLKKFFALRHKKCSPLLFIKIFFTDTKYEKNFNLTKNLRPIYRLERFMYRLDSSLYINPPLRLL